MKPDLVSIYEAATVTEAQLLVQRLAAEGIEAFVDNTDTPLDGLTAAQQINPVRVLPENAAQARRIAQAFAKEASGQSEA